MLAARASEEVGELVRQRHHLAVHAHVCEAMRGGSEGDDSAGNKDKSAQKKLRIASRRARGRFVGRAIKRDKWRAGRRGVGGRGAELAGWPTGSGAGARFARARFSNPTLTPTLTRPVKASTEVVAQRATLTLTRTLTFNQAQGRTEVVAHRDARHGHNGAIGLQGADDLEETLIHLVVLVLPRPVMAAVDRGRGACRTEGAASSAACMCSHMRCVAWARASLASPSPASCSCTLSPLWLTSLPTARTCWPENCPLCRCWLEIRICAGAGGTERVGQRRAGVRHGTHAATCRSHRTR